MSDRNVLRTRIYHRDGGHSILRKDDHHIWMRERNKPEDLEPAEHLSEVWVERRDVMARNPQDREKIFVKENMVFLSAKQNLGFTRARKYHARLYLIHIYGEERIQAFLDLIYGEGSATVAQLLEQVKPK